MNPGLKSLKSLNPSLSSLKKLKIIGIGKITAIIENKNREKVPLQLLVLTYLR